MSHYVTAARVVELEPGLTIDDADAFDALVERAERDVDLLLGPIPRIEATGRKLDLANLTDVGVEALERAVAAQTVYLLANAPRIDAGARQPASVKGPDFEEVYGTPAQAGGRWPIIGPRTAQELEPLRYLVRTTARARP
jgi:hypothetical protein